MRPGRGRAGRGGLSWVRERVPPPDLDGLVADLLADDDRTYAELGGLTLRDEPSPLFQLLVLSALASTRISAALAAGAARELWRAGWRTPERMLGSTRHQRVAALGRGGYRRYDESTATWLTTMARQLLDEERGDLRRLRPGSGSAQERRRALAGALQAYPRIGPTGAAIFTREVQAVWPELGPFFDDRALRAASALGLPTDARALARHAPDGRVAALAAALARRGARAR